MLVECAENGHEEAVRTRALLGVYVEDGDLGFDGYCGGSVQGNVC